MRPEGQRARRGSAMILVLVMTLSLAGLAISAIYLMSSANLLTTYYNKERDFRNAAEQAVALAKSRATHDTTLAIPDDTALVFATGVSLTDASGTTIPGIKVNTYISFTGDTSGRYGKFITILSQSYDTGGTRTVRRLDLTSESFSRYAMFADSFPSSLVYGPGEFIRGRSHSNTSWYGMAGSTFYDTVSVPTGAGHSIAVGPTYSHGTVTTASRSWPRCRGMPPRRTSASRRSRAPTRATASRASSSRGGRPQVRRRRRPRASASSTWTTTAIVSSTRARASWKCSTWPPASTREACASTSSSPARRR
jgi:hypothetical protein